MEDNYKRRRSGVKTQNFAKDKTRALKKWLFNHIEEPYLQEEDYKQLEQQSSLSRAQIKNWFTNIRKVRIIFI